MSKGEYVSRNLFECLIFNSKVLADLAIWEPKTFEAIVNTCRQRAVDDGIKGVSEKQTDNKLVTTID